MSGGKGESDRNCTEVFSDDLTKGRIAKIEVEMSKLIRGVNDLETIDPFLAEQWHPTKNGNLTPKDVTAGSGKEVWWIGKCGHEWPARIYSRYCGKGCPYCSNVKVLPGFNDILTVKPELIKDWNWEKNVSIIPEMILAGSHEHVWWKCSKCGHEWPSEVRMRAKHDQGCPECAKTKMGVTFRKNLIASGKKTLAEEHPEIAAEWHPTKNGSSTPSDYTSSSGVDIWWKCRTCGYEWPATINNRVYKRSGCPLCAGSVIVPGINDLQTQFPNLAAEWHPQKNLPKTANTTAPFSSDKVWWICKYGHEYQCRVADRQKGVGCSECSKRFRTSLPEKIVEYYIKQSFPGIISNYRPSFLAGSEIDIYIPDIQTGIEYDGQRYHQDVDRDKKKDVLCSENKVRLIRIRERKCPAYERKDPTYILNNQSDKSFSDVIEQLLHELGIRIDGIDLSKDKQRIIESYRDTAISGSIAEDYPNLAKEWHPTKNGALKPENIPSTKSHDEYYWKCGKCGYEWKAVLYERIVGMGCPACAGKIIIPGFNDLATTHPELATEWHPTKNNGLTPQNVSKGQNKRVWWKCSKCGYEWPARINKRVAGSGCDKCARERWAKKQYKPVFQFSLSGELINEFSSARKAADELGISRVSIQHVCRGVGRLKTAGGFYWSYYIDGKISEKTDSKTSKPVIQYSKDGTYITEYENATIAASAIGISPGSIRQACKGTNGRKTAGGYVWRYKSP